MKFKVNGEIITVNMNNVLYHNDKRIMFVNGKELEVEAIITKQNPTAFVKLLNEKDFIKICIKDVVSFEQDKSKEYWCNKDEWEAYKTYKLLNNGRKVYIGIATPFSCEYLEEQLAGVNNEI